MTNKQRLELIQFKSIIRKADGTTYSEIWKPFAETAQESAEIILEDNESHVAYGLRFTGATDDKKKAVFEGDIIMLNDVSYYVYWDEMNYTWGLELCKGQEIPDYPCFFLWHVYSDKNDDVIVAGNIYENPDLP